VKPLPVAQLAACCTPVQSAVLDERQAAELASALKAVADPTRLRLLSMIAAAAAGEAGEVCVCDLTDPLGLTQPTVSHHLKILLDRGLVEREKRGVWAYYRPVPGALDALAAVLTGRPPVPVP
jgi:ArsR family transcriptional regulator, arsenate/arsenite/antimonite-responsive transcriptional repressor